LQGAWDTSTKSPASGPGQVSGEAKTKFHDAQHTPIARRSLSRQSHIHWKQMP
jgi:hypothetical protein